jgi:hypothetical protein
MHRSGLNQHTGSGRALIRALAVDDQPMSLTSKLVGNLFELENLGPKELKGIAGPVRAWAALRPASVDSRFEAFHASGLTELVGREEELELLLQRWSKAKTGEGQVALLSGEPGIGKSRLTAAILERFANEPHTRLRYFCSPQHTDSALYPIISQMERSAGFAHDDTAQAKLDKLDTVLALSFTPRRDAALFLPKCSRCRTMNAIPRSNSPRNNGDRGRWKPLLLRWRHYRDLIRC